MGIFCNFPLRAILRGLDRPVGQVSHPDWGNTPTYRVPDRHLETSAGLEPQSHRCRLGGCFGRRIDGFRFLVYLVVFAHPGNPSICPKDTDAWDGLSMAPSRPLEWEVHRFGLWIKAGGGFAGFGCGKELPASWKAEGPCLHKSARGERKMIAPCFFPRTAKHWGSNLRYREWESVTPIPGSCFPLVFLSPSLSGQMPDAVTLAPGSFCVSQSAVRC